MTFKQGISILVLGITVAFAGWFAAWKTSTVGAVEPAKKPASFAAGTNREGELTSSDPWTLWQPSDEWVDRHSHLTVEALSAERDELKRQLAEQSDPELTKRFQAGVSEHVSSEQRHMVTSEDLAQIAAIEMVPGQGTFRTVLPSEEYPELYELKGKKEWLNRYIRQRTTQVSE